MRAKLFCNSRSQALRLLSGRVCGSLGRISVSSIPAAHTPYP
jgi:hypothetical protein